MLLNLTRPICFIDLETTGTLIAKDRIVEISILKVFPDEKEESKTWLVNPEIPIPIASTVIHGITDEIVADKPTFKEIAKDVSNMIKDCDLGGYNSNKFDIPLLAEEMIRADVDFNMKNRLSIDVQNIFYKKEQRTLSAAHKFYCKKELKETHDAESDVKATYKVLKGQIDMYKDLKNDIKYLAKFSSRENPADLAGFIVYNREGKECFAFGKHKGKIVAEVLKDQPGYFGWMIGADFPMYTKKVLTAIRLRAISRNSD